MNLPYPIYGTITASDDSTPSTRATLRNDRTGETTSTTSNTSGEYVVDAANFTSGYMSSDRVTLIVGYGNEEGSGTILLSSDTHNIDITLTVISESTDTTLCQIQDVLDELGDKTTSDISYERVRKIILRAEAEIEERTGTKFSSTTIVNEIYDFNQYTSYKSPETLLFPRTSGYGDNGRGDSITGFIGSDTIKLEKNPIINSVTQLSAVTTTVATTLSVDSTSDFPSAGTICIYNSTNGVEHITYTGKTSTTFTGCTRSANSTTASAHADDSYVAMIGISKNTTGDYQSDSWEDLEPQTGGGGDYLVYSDTGLIKFVNSAPYFGKRKIKVTYSYGYISVPRTVERLAILLSVRDVITSKRTEAQFDGSSSINLGGEIAISKFDSPAYLNWINEEIERLWEIVGDLEQSIA